MTTLINIADVKRLTAATDNIDQKLINPHIVTTQQLKVMPRLGALLLQSLLDSVDSRAVVTDITQANPAVATTAQPHGYSTGDEVAISGSKGMLIDGNYTITVLTTTTFEIDGLDSSALPAYDGGSADVMAISPDNYELYLLVVPAMAWQVLASAMPFIHVHVVNAGLIRQGTSNLSDGNQSVDHKTMIAMKDQAEKTANGLEIIYHQHLQQNQDKYPLWIGSCGSSTPSSCINGGVNKTKMPWRAL